MSWRYHSRYSPDAYRPVGRGVCDRCQFVWKLEDLQYQYDFRGDTLANTRFRVCPYCMDKPYEGRRPIRLPPDPRPLLDPRVEPLAQEENAGAPFPGLAYPPPLPPTPPIPPVIVSYITEDGSQSYISEDGNTIYVPE